MWCHRIAKHCPTLAALPDTARQAKGEKIFSYGWFCKKKSCKFGESVAAKLELFLGVLHVRRRFRKKGFSLVCQNGRNEYHYVKEDEIMHDTPAWTPK